ncbi:hypothetical protein KEM56_001349 [Ascosphaera pollenicola]|nr:hypothetical protein KEM56_001349 [Ascosphaera pollenicola]
MQSGKPLGSSKTRTLVDGGELSTIKPFAHAVLSSMNEVAEALHLKACFGDAYASSNTTSKIPEFALLNDTGDLEGSWNEWATSGESKKHWLRSQLGQVQMYLEEYNVRYGFSTDINDTIFNKREKSGLRLSRPIPSAMVARKD